MASTCAFVKIEIPNDCRSSFSESNNPVIYRAMSDEFCMMDAP